MFPFVCQELFIYFWFHYLPINNQSPPPPKQTALLTSVIRTQYSIVAVSIVFHAAVWLFAILKSSWNPVKKETSDGIGSIKLTEEEEEEGRGEVEGRKAATSIQKGSDHQSSSALPTVSAAC